MSLLTNPVYLLMMIIFAGYVYRDAVKINKKHPILYAVFAFLFGPLIGVLVYYYLLRGKVKPEIEDKKSREIGILTNIGRFLGYPAVVLFVLGILAYILGRLTKSNMWLKGIMLIAISVILFLFAWLIYWLGKGKKP